MFFVFRRWPFLRRAGVVVFALPLMFAGGSLVGDLAARSIGGVGSLEISYQEFQSVYRAISERYLGRYNLDELPPDLAQSVAEQTRAHLVSEYLVRAAVDARRIAPPDSAIVAEIRAAPEFQDESGDFSISLFNDYAPDARRLETEVRRTLQRRALLNAARPEEMPAVRAQLAAYRRQQRIVEETTLTVDAEFNISEEDIAAYYSANWNEYQIREEADWEYILIAAAAPEESAPPDEETVLLAQTELREERDARERRTARHIFVAGEDEEARARAEDLAARARAAPDSFAALAREFSDDAGSAANGGDLGIIVRGDLPPAMDAEAFLLEDRQISRPVAVDGGFSILQTELSAPPAAPEDARAEAESRARRIIARDNLAAQVEELQEIAHINIGSLVSVAAAAGVAVQSAAAVPRNPAEADAAAPTFFADEEILAQLFVEEVLEDGETSPAIALDDDVYLMARAIRHQSAQARPLSEAGEGIARRLAAREQIRIMLEEADENGEIALPPNAEWRGPWTLSLLGDEDAAQTGGINDAVLGEIFAAALDGGLPAFALSPGDGIVRVFRILETRDFPPRADDEDAIGALLEESEQSAAISAYLRSLADEYEVYFDDLSAR